MWVRERATSAKEQQNDSVWGECEAEEEEEEEEEAPTEEVAEALSPLDFSTLRSWQNTLERERPDYEFFYII